MGDQHNFAALDWVVGEIEETLDEARQALEAYVEDPKDSTRIRFCLTHIHQVHGSLRMVEFHGPSLLAEEMEFLAQAIMNKSVSSMSDALEVLMRSLLQLPLYLDHIKVYRDDSASYILPLLNDLRAVRKESYLSETNLFSPQLDGLDTVRGKRHQVLGEKAKLDQLLKKLREMYQFAAASVLRGIKVDENLIYLEKVFGRLEVLASGTKSQPMWRVAMALVEGLKGDNIELSVAVRGLLRYIARELRILAEAAPGSFDRPVNVSLLKNLLFYVGRAEDSGARVDAVKKEFDLSDRAFGGSAANQAGSALDPEAVKSVVIALGDELNSIKMNLDNTLTGHLGTEELVDVLPVIKRVADTLAVLGISELRKQMVAQVQEIEELSLANELDEERLTEVAKAIIEVEQRLEAIGKAVDKTRDIDNIDEKKIEIDEAKLVVVRECQIGLEKAKDAIVEYISAQWDIEKLDNVDVQLADIRGGLNMIPLPRPAAIVEICTRYIKEQLVDARVQPEWTSLEYLADAIASVDYYLERLTSDMSEDADSLLDVAEESILALGYTLPLLAESAMAETETPAVVEATVEDAPAERQEGPTNDKHDVPVDVIEASSEPAEIAEAVDGGGIIADLTPLTPDSFEAVHHQPDVETVSEPEAIVEEDEEENDIDDEIIEIFIEEAGEVLETLNEYAPVWIANTADDEAMTTVRRAFHTLKGSGRMVSASDISELAWEVENMLNRVIDNSVTLSSEYCQLVQNVMTLIPGLITAFENKAKDPNPYATAQYSKWAKALSEGSIPDDLFDLSGADTQGAATDVVDVSHQNVTESDVKEPEAQPEVAADEDDNEEDLVLLEIFSSEATSHLQTIDLFVADMDSQAPLFTPPTDDLQRALHTLKGSAKMAQVTGIAAIMEPLEAFAKEMVTYQVNITPDILQLIRDAAEYTRLGLQDIEARRPVSLPKLEQFIARNAELRELAVGHLVRLKELEQTGQDQVDPRLLSIFMAEEMLLLLDADILLSRWLDDAEVGQQLPALTAELSKLALGAEQANLPDMASLSSLLREIYQALGETAREKSVIDILCLGHSALLDMVDSVAAGQTVQPPNAEVVAQVQALLSRPVADTEFAADSEIAGSEFTDTISPNNDDIAANDSPTQNDSIDLSDLGSAEENALSEWPEPAENEAAVDDGESAVESMRVDEDMVLADKANHDLAQSVDASDDDASDSFVDELSGVEDLVGKGDAIDETIDSGNVDGNLVAAADSEHVLALQNVSASDPAEQDYSNLFDGVDHISDDDESLDDGVTTPGFVETDTVADLSDGDESLDDELVIDGGELLLDEDDSIFAGADDGVVEDLLDDSDDSLVIDDDSNEDVIVATLPDQGGFDTVDGEGSMRESAQDESTIAIDEVISYDAIADDQRSELNIEVGTDDLNVERGADASIDLSPEDEVLATVDDLPELDHSGVDLELSAAPDGTEYEAMADAHADVVDGLDGTDDITALADNSDADVADTDTLNIETVALEPLASPITDATVKTAPIEKPANGLLDIIDQDSEDFDEDILEIFIEEADELIEELDEAIHLWQNDWSDRDSVEEIKRILHTLKGGARLSGMTNLGELTHNYESYLIMTRLDAVDDQFFAKIHVYQDQVLSAVRAIKLFMAGDTVPVVDAVPDIDAIVDAPEHHDTPSAVEPEVTEAPIEPVVATAVEQQSTLTTEAASSNVVPFVAREMIEGATAPSFASPMAAKKSGPQELIKVPAELLEELVNLAGETSISRSRLEEQVTDFSFSLDEVESTLQRLHEQLRRLDIETEAQVLFRQEQMAAHEEFDPLEMDRYSHLQQLSRSLIESASDLDDLRIDLTDKLRDTETLLVQQSRINTTLQEGLMRSRMVPFSRLVPRLRRIVRQVASELGKNVSLELDNIEGELDRTVLERMVPPFEHMLRNAVDHGIESPEDRINAGKQEAGRIVLTLGREGGDVIIHLADDGRGINLKRVREKAIERELMAPSAELSDHDIMQFILHAGFSTAENVTQISGRGVGMDVVHSEIKQLGGSVVINSQWGKGTEFVVRLPFTLSVNRALMVEISGDNYAIPLSSIEGIVRVSPFELEHYYSDADARFEYANENYHMRYLGSLLNSDIQPKLEGHVLPIPVLLVRSAEHTMALQVDGLLGSREVVVKSLGQQFSTVAGLSGATVMGDGSVVVILDPHALVRQEIAAADLRLAAAQGGYELAGHVKEEAAPVQAVQTIMVVDDSVTVRKVTTRFLEREGFEVITAKDGVDALRILQDKIPDLMLLDIEMPRMDGFEVAKNVRSSSRWSELPIIMITSRTGEKHREHAFSLGVNNYLGKPYQEDILLDAIGQLLNSN